MLPAQKPGRFLETVAYLLNRARAAAGGRELGGMAARIGLPHYQPVLFQDAPGRCQSAASQSAPWSAARSRTCRDGRISGLGGCKIASLVGRGQDGKAWPRSP